MEVSMKNLMVYPDHCLSDECRSCFSSRCQLCLKCLSQDAIEYLKTAYIEHNNRQDCKRIFPPSMINVSMSENKWQSFGGESWLLNKNLVAGGINEYE